MPWLFAAIGYKATAQEIPPPPPPPPAQSESKEIIIRKNNDKDTKLVIEFKNDSVLINGKPMIQFSDDAVTINNRTIRFHDLEHDFDGFQRDMEKFEKEIKVMGKRMGDMEPGPFLGVVTGKTEKGLVIEEVVKESPAEKAGLKDGDIITKIEGKEVTTPQELAKIVSGFEAGKEVKIHFKREGKDRSVKAKLAERKMGEARVFSFNNGDKSRTITVPGHAMVPRMPHAPNVDMENFEFKMDGFVMRPKLGLKVQDLEEGNGVKVLDVEAESPAAKAGLQKDDVIIEIGGAKVENTDEVREQLRANEEKNNYAIKAKRNNSVMNFEVKIPKKLKTANL